MSDTFHCHGCNRRRGVEALAPARPSSKRRCCLDCDAAIRAKAANQVTGTLTRKPAARRRCKAYTTPASLNYFAKTGE